MDGGHSHSATPNPTRQVPTPGILGNGEYRVLLGPDGTGFSALADRALSAAGVFVYLRDRESGEVWSAGLEPGRRPPERYRARRVPGGYEFFRTDGEIDCRLEVSVSASRNAELRRVTLTNRSARSRRIELTSYAETVLLDPAAHAAHPAFSKLFLQTEAVRERRALVVRRRPRAHGESHPWLVHAVSGGEEFEFESDRVRFVGRGRSLRAPAALVSAAPLSGTTGSVLDPAVSLRVVLDLAPGGSRAAVFLLGAEADRNSALALVDAVGSFDAELEAAARAEAGRLAACGLTRDEADRWEALAAAVLTVDPELRTGRREPPPGALDLEELDALGLSARTPFVLAGEDRSGELVRARRYWAALGIPVEAVIVSPEAPADPLPDDPGGVHRFGSGALSPGLMDLLRWASAWTVDASWPALDRLNAGADAAALETSSPSGGPGKNEPAPAEPTEPLRFWNGTGGFSPEGDAYVIRLAPREDGTLRLPPLPWINVLANDRFGALVSETGAGTVWSGNSREHRLTPWSNDPLLDPHAEAFYVRDEETGRYWSPLPGPAPAPAPYEVRHGFGESTFALDHAGLAHRTSVFVAAEAPLQVTLISIANRSGRPRRLSLFAWRRLVLGGLASETARFVVSDRDPGSGALLARNPAAGPWAKAVAFAAAVASAPVADERASGDGRAFLGASNDPARPAAVASGFLDERFGANLDPAFVQRLTLDLPPDASVEVAFLLGEGREAAETRALVERYGDLAAVHAEREAVRASWREGLSRVRVETPSPALDLMVNGWLAYQTLTCRIRGRTAFYQSGGAFGFRDQLQDAGALLPWWPEALREQLLLAAAHQFVEGDVLHWWHPPQSRGIRTRFADDLVWLPFLTAHYVRSTGDSGVLHEPVPFLAARSLAPGEDEVFLRPELSGKTADLYEHCCRALDRALTRGPHGLPLFGTGDWNDGMNRVGREGRGESVWMGFFLHRVLEDFLPLCEDRGDGERVERYRAYREAVDRALEIAGWDGEWYRRAYYDDGTPLGSRENDECRIDALAQAWAVISGEAPPERAGRAMDAVERELVSEADGLIRLLAPPFDRTPKDPGYIKGYIPGVRENGGQYTHAALWVVRAGAELGRRDRAARLLNLLNPVNHALTPEAVERYRVEPYVVCADVYGAPPHVGRGGWTWYTGSSGWMLRVALESVLGLGFEDGNTLVVAPCIPDDWPEFKAAFRLPGDGTRVEVAVTNPDGCAAAVVSAKADGAGVSVRDGAARVCLSRDGGAHRVSVVLGPSPGGSRT
jgi:cellobiose phosphorylase